MTDAQGALLAFIILTLAIAGTRLWPLVQWRMRERRYRLEAERFKREPRVGDKAGYKLIGDWWMVGVVQIDADTRVAQLVTERVTAFGVTNSTGTRDMRDLRWFPPDTPLGINHVTDQVEVRQ